MANSILVPAAVFESVAKRLSRLASQCGVELTINPGQSTLYRLDSDRNVDPLRAIECARITVGDMPRTNGYSLIGRLTHTAAGNVIAMAPGHRDTTTPVEWRTANPTCDHCNTERRRIDTFLVQCPNGEIKRVGRNCLADFLKADASGMVALDAFQDAIRSLEDESDGDGLSCGGGIDWSLSTLGYLTYAVASIEYRGFHKSGSKQPTSAHIAFIGGKKPDSRLYHAVEEWTACQPTKAHTDRAAEIIAYIRSSEDTSDYMHNLRVACSSDVTSHRFTGILASAPQAYNRHLGQVAERQARASQPDAGHIAPVGERIDCKATILRVNAIDSLYGTKLVVTMKADSGHELVTFTTSSGICANDVGKRFAVRGTVKEHSSYQGRSQTNLSRCNFKPAE